MNARTITMSALGFGLLGALGMLSACGAAPEGAEGEEVDQSAEAVVTPKLAYTYTDRFEHVYDDKGSGATLDLSIWRPLTPPGFVSLGDHAVSGYAFPEHSVLIVKDDPAFVAQPIGYNLVWTTMGMPANVLGAIWKPIAPAGFTCLGHVASANIIPPPPSAVRCVRSDLAVSAPATIPIWNTGGGTPSSPAMIFTTQGGKWQAGAYGLSTGTFVTFNSPNYPITAFATTNLDATKLVRSQARDVTFLVTADLHYGDEQMDNNEQANAELINRMNATPLMLWPAGTSQPLGTMVGTPRGVLIAGDLTGGDKDNWYGVDGLKTLASPYCWSNYGGACHLDGFTDRYGGGSSTRIHFPPYEGYGNHDVDETSFGGVPAQIASRTAQRRPYLVNQSSAAYYSWDWEDVHFVNLNCYAGGSGLKFSNGGLQFLIDDLASQVGQSGRPVVLMQHFGVNTSFSTQDRWWTASERAAFHAALAGYNIYGIFAGHDHETYFLDWNAGDGVTAKIPVFHSGRYCSNADCSAHAHNHVVVHIGAGAIDVAEMRSTGWNQTRTIPIDATTGRLVNP
ncbi:MAG: Vps62-related protein [Byssovorax sp.]